MNDQHDTTAPEKAPAPLRWEARHPTEASAIRATSFYDLVTLETAFAAGIDAFLSILNRPRCDADSKAYAWVSHEMDRLSEVREMMMEEMRLRPSDGSHDYEEAVRSVVAYDTRDCGDGFLDVMATMSRMVAAHEEKCGEIKRVAMGFAA